MTKRHAGIAPACGFAVEPGGGIGFSASVGTDRDELAADLQQLAARQVFLGTSSWKYPGWFGSIYERDRYIWRGRFSNSRFERDCLAEYARVFPTVSVDATYYKFPDEAFLQGLAAQVPPGFQFAFKVCDEITLKHYPSLPRFGARAGRANPHFLDAARFSDSFLAPCEGIRPHVGLIMFEFSRFHTGDFARGSDFVAALETFLAALPRGWPYGIELRNRHWLHPDYFALLARHGVTHIYNAWSDMPPVEDQMALPGSDTNPSLLAARYLLREGRPYEEAVRRFHPYADVQEPNTSARTAAAALARRGLNSKGLTKVFQFVNNRFEGHAPAMIRAVAQAAKAALNA